MIREERHCLLTPGLDEKRIADQTMVDSGVRHGRVIGVGELHDVEVIGRAEVEQEFRIMR